MVSLVGIIPDLDRKKHSMWKSIDHKRMLACLLCDKSDKVRSESGEFNADLAVLNKLSPSSSDEGSWDSQNLHSQRMSSRPTLRAALDKEVSAGELSGT